MQLQVETQIYKKNGVGHDIKDAGSKATNYITSINNNGIQIHPAEDVNQRIEITPNGTEIYQDGSSVAQYGQTARIGTEDNSRFLIEADKLQAYDDNNNKYFEVSATGLSYGINTVASTDYVNNSISDSEDNLKDYVDDAIVEAVGEGTTGLKQYVDNHLEELQQQIDGAIDTWYYAADPLPDGEHPNQSNAPASNWDTVELKEAHLRDLYFNTLTGHTFRWAKENNIYKWILIEDTDATKALADAAIAQDTADGKRRVFVTQPIPPYDVGDLWTGGLEGDIKRCKIAKILGQVFADSDWELASKYTDDSNLIAFQTEVERDYATKIEVKTTTDGISQNVSKIKTKMAGMYAVSSTLADTIDKTATITPALSSGEIWELTKGTIVTVKFTIANTVAAPTLNVNSTGAKPILNYMGSTLSKAEYEWVAGTVFTFVYNGAAWMMQDSTVAVQINEAKTSINQTATSIESLASNQTEYIKPDGTTGTNSIASAISQHAEDISLKVSKNDVINQINVSTEGIKIDASKIKISGTTTFISGSTNTTLADVYAQKSEVVSDVIIDYATGDDNIHAPSDSANWNTNPTWEEGKYVWQRTRKTINGVTTPTYACIQGAAGEGGTSYYTYIRYSANSDGSNMTSEPTANTIYIGLYTGEASVVPPYNNPGWTWSKYVGDPGGQGDQGYSVSEVKILYYLKSGTTAPSKPNSTDYPNGVISASIGVDIWTTAVPIYVTDYNYFVCAQTKLSNNSYIWSDPTINNGLTTSNQRAAEAIAKANSASYKEQRIYYRTSTVKTFVEADYPTTWVNSDESSANVYNQWTTKIPPLSADKTDPNANKYLYLYTCIQRQNVANELSHTKALLDESTTVIDGGNIVTGSIAANKISVNNLAAIRAQIGNWHIEDVANTAVFGGGLYTDNYNFGNGILISPGYRPNNSTAVGILPTDKSWTITAGNQFGVTTTGELYATGAVINGAITLGEGSNAYTKDETNTVINNIQIGGRNLLLQTGININQDSAQAAYRIPLSEAIQVGQTYVLQLWDVEITNGTTRNLNDIGIDVKYTDGTYTITIGGWYGNDYFEDPTVSSDSPNDAISNHLTLFFTLNNDNIVISGGNRPSSGNITQIDNNGNLYIELYNINSTNNDNRSLGIGFYKLEKGNKPTEWSVAPEDVDENVANSSSDLQSLVNSNNTLLQELSKTINFEEWVMKYGDWIQVINGEALALEETTYYDLEVIFDQVENIETGVTNVYKLFTLKSEYEPILDFDAVAESGITYYEHSIEIQNDQEVDIYNPVSVVVETTNVYGLYVINSNVYRQILNPEAIAEENTSYYKITTVTLCDLKTTIPNITRVYGSYILDLVTTPLSNFLNSHIILDNQGIKIRGNNVNSELQLYNNGIQIQQGENVIASFGESVRLGNDKDSHIKLTSTELGFFTGEELDENDNEINKVAFINSNEQVLSIANGELTDSLKIGPFQWKKISDNRITLMFIGQ